MKIKSLLLIAVATLGLTTATMAQVPNYVPTNGLVGWWPFNGNANDISGNGNNGTNNGATLSVDRFNYPNQSFDFDGISNFIEVPVSQTNVENYTISCWYNFPLTASNDTYRGMVQASGAYPNALYSLTIQMSPDPTYPNPNKVGVGINGPGVYNGMISNSTYNDNNWHHVVGVLSSNSGNQITSSNIKIYIDGVLANSSSTAVDYGAVVSPVNGLGNTIIGKIEHANWGSGKFYIGKLDDIGLWNRALTQQEITNLYTATNCAKNTAISPQTNSLTTSSTATFTATTSDPNPAYVWQSNLGQGFQTLNNVGNYSGTNTGTLNIANVQLQNHTQPIRVISTSGDCIDTSNVAVINILDTCITSVTVYDTLLTSVTDTLIINSIITGINPPNNQNTLKVFPNPANTQITIDYGNFSSMAGYTLKIVNAVGQTVFTTPINQQLSFIDLSTWTGSGTYFVQLINPQNNTIENRKIVIQ